LSRAPALTNVFYSFNEWISYVSKLLWKSKGMGAGGWGRPGEERAPILGCFFPSKGVSRTKDESIENSQTIAKSLTRRRWWRPSCDGHGSVVTSTAAVGSGCGPYAVIHAFFDRTPRCPAEILRISSTSCTLRNDSLPLSHSPPPSLLVFLSSVRLTSFLGRRRRRREKEIHSARGAFCCAHPAIPTSSSSSSSSLGRFETWIFRGGREPSMSKLRDQNVDEEQQQWPPQRQRQQSVFVL